MAAHGNQLHDKSHSRFTGIEWNLNEKTNCRLESVEPPQHSTLQVDSSRHKVSNEVERIGDDTTLNGYKLSGDLDGVVTDVKNKKQEVNGVVGEITLTREVESDSQSSLTSSRIRSPGGLVYQPLDECSEDVEMFGAAIASKESCEQRLVQLEHKVGKNAVDEPKYCTGDVAESTDGRIAANEESSFHDGKNVIHSCLTLNLPLEVIGACWFMQRESETSLQAVTSTNEKINVRLTKKDSRVMLAFEAISSTGKSFEQKSNRCECYVEELLEPTRKPATVESFTLCALPSGPRDDLRTKETAGDSLNSVKIGLSGFANKTSCARSNKGIHYEDTDTETEDGEPKTTGGIVSDNEDLESSVENDDFDKEDGANTNDAKCIESVSEKLPQITQVSNSLRQKRKSSPKKISNNTKVDVEDEDERDDDDEDYGSEDYEWKPSKHAKLIKLSRSGLRLKVKVKNEPEILYAEEIQEVDETGSGDDTESDGTCDEDSDDGEANFEVDEHVGVIPSTRHSSSLKRKISHVGENRSKTRHRNVDGPKWEKKGNCPHCGVFYGNLNQHIGLYCPKNPNRQRAYHCCYCKFRSLDRAQLIEHKATHVLARDFKCEICDSAFFTRQRLVRHMRYVHLLGTNPVRIYTCDRCGKRFRYHSHYDRHLTIHSEEKTAQCDKCGKFFKNSHNVRNHQSRMHPGKPESFPFYCDKCGQGAHSLTAHRCVVPGEMHGSRRRRAPRSSHLPTSSQVIDEQAAPDQPFVSNSSQLSPIMVDQSPQTPLPAIAVRRAVSSGVDDRQPSTAACPPSVDYHSTNFLFASADTDCPSTVSSKRVASSQPGDRYATSPSQPLHRQSTFDPHPAAHLAPHLIDNRLSAGIQNHSMLSPPGVESSNYDRRSQVALLDHHLPALAHQSQQPHHLPALAHQSQQPHPYSNLFVVDPLLRAANMMYRGDY